MYMYGMYDGIARNTTVDVIGIKILFIHLITDSVVITLCVCIVCFSYVSITLLFRYLQLEMT